MHTYQRRSRRWPALAELKAAVLALRVNPSIPYSGMIEQFNMIEVALARAKRERASAENRSIAIASLPHEILSQIFEILRHEDSEWIGGPGIAPSIRVSHVSATWRDIALSTASLWTAIYSSPSHDDTFYHTMINRSQESLLECTIRVEPSQDQTSAAMLAALVPSNAHRLRVLRIIAPMWFIDGCVATLRELSAPRMSQLLLHITNYNPQSGPLLSRQRIFMGGTPKLVQYDATGFDFRMIRPPLADVKILNVTSYASDTLRDALLDVALTVHALGIIIVPDTLAIFPPIQMSSLVSLELLTEPFEIITFLGMIEAPELKSLKLSVPRRSRSTSYGSVVGKFSKLLSLQMEGMLESGILIAFPTLERLRVGDMHSRPTHLGDVFDLSQDSFSTLTPRLIHITAPTRFKESIEAFCTARQSLGLSVPLFVALEDI
ncbi:hypothetical protein HWV62_34171 [Athelia sp. TMB]|nr:hypothetical protein HWV62_34171 [Athelia sp. TMB]